MTDYRKLQRQGAALLVRLYEANAVNHMEISTEEWRLIEQLRAIPKPGSAGGPKPGAGRKKKATTI